MLSYLIGVIADTTGNFGSVGLEYALYNVADFFYNLGS